MERLILRTSFFSHGKSNSCGVAIGYCGTQDLKVVNTARDKNGRILILDTDLNGTKNIVFGGDFNLIFDCKFDVSGGNPILKKNLWRN